MSLADEVDLEDFVSRPEKISAAEISAICQEAGLQAVRKNRYVILTKDFEESYRKHVKKADTEFEFYKWQEEDFKKKLEDREAEEDPGDRERKIKPTTVPFGRKI